MKKLIFSLAVMAICGVGQAQPVRGPIANPAPGVLDGVYVKEHIPTKKVVPYEYVREADVTWSKRVWRAIDLREKFNHPLYYPHDEYFDGMDPIKIFGGQNNEWRRNPTRWSLWTIIRYHVMTGDLTIYSPYNPKWQAWKDGDLLKYPIKQSDPEWGDPTNSNLTFLTDSVFRKNVMDYEYLGRLILDPNPIALKDQWGYDSVDANNNTVYPPPEFVWYKSEDIVQYRIKEDWFFDNERSVLDVRIIAICPVVYQLDQNGAVSGFKELFWLYFPECRYVFQNFYVQSRHNDSQRMSFDDLFWKRMFQSYVIKESNIYDRDIESYKSGVDALLESEKIKEKISIFEHDLWSF